MLYTASAVARRVGGVRTLACETLDVGPVGGKRRSDRARNQLVLEVRADIVAQRRRIRVSVHRDCVLGGGANDLFLFP